MGTRGEEVLWTLLWACDMFSRPTFRNLTDSFESWAYRNGFWRQLQRLERRQLIESLCGHSGDRLHRLTETGCLSALGGRNPEKQWNRRWDGRWRLVLFDVPVTRNWTRNKLRGYLQNRGFGFLQHSVWITPDPAEQERALLADGPVDVESLILLEARPCAGESDAQIVAGSWDFAEINTRYAAYQQVLARRPHGYISTKAEAAALHRWMCEERAAWMEAMKRDPLLPACLLPRSYSGRKAWRNRLKTMSGVGEQIRGFRGG